MSNLEPNVLEKSKYMRGLYNTDPSFKIKKQLINSGYKFLAAEINNNVPKGMRVWVVGQFDFRLFFQTSKVYYPAMLFIKNGVIQQLISNQA